MAQLPRAKFAPIQSLPFESISGTYALLGTLANPTIVYWVQNLTNGTITFSTDGVVDAFVLPTMAYVIIDVEANKGLQNQLALAEGSNLYVKGNVSSGAVYLSTLYMG